MKDTIKNETEMRSSCPQISSAAKAHFKQAMDDHVRCFAAKGLTCNKSGLIDDTSAHGCETAYIGRDYTWHTHKCGITPSDADINTTKKLGRRYLCIGEDETKKTHCYDLQNNMRKTCVLH